MRRIARHSSIMYGEGLPLWEALFQVFYIAEELLFGSSSSQHRKSESI